MLLVVGDTGFVRVGHVAEIRRLIPLLRPTVVPVTVHMTLMRRMSLLPVLGEFLIEAAGRTAAARGAHEAR
ncbi:hypothetical protein [Streptomyces sp. NBC_01483]|uniref:hypothetical protein n=1 Tax=Streptomyces sp. NBC_01483 TaxID=2903883 RepID=UPI002E33A739|nr:hypothetical protein [Streptomyces sp. NBC_01483]